MKFQRYDRRLASVPVPKWEVPVPAEKKGPTLLIDDSFVDGTELCLDDGVVGELLLLELAALAL